VTAVTDRPRSLGGDGPKPDPAPQDTGEAQAAASAVSPPRGFRSQPTHLKILLVASLSALAVGVVRCSIEMTTVTPPVSRIGVERALVDLNEGTAWGPADSVSVRAARVFAEALREAGRVDVRLAPPGASGFDAIARLRISEVDGGIRVAVGIVDGSSGRALMETGGEGAPEMLPGLLNAAAVRVASELGVGEDGGATRAKADAESGGA
jgi:hypothetical protein